MIMSVLDAAIPGYTERVARMVQLATIQLSQTDVLRMGTENARIELA